MTGRHSGLVKQVCPVAPAAVWKHCIIHHQALATKRMPQELQVVLDEAVMIVNLIKLHALNARLFSILCNEMAVERGLVEMFPTLEDVAEKTGLPLNSV